ncbi:MAG: superoxide dismutase family protein [Oscillospiraceae bacterium]|nr:superoxide dismutase family protein [Oscillospiraceae bacterium]
MDYYSVFARKADAAACIKGSCKYPNIKGTVCLYQLCGCVMVTVEVDGLPVGTKPCGKPIFAFHIHEGYECSGNKDDCFANAKGHFNPYNCQHPYHAGDMPPLFGMNGRAFLAFMTDRFKVAEVLGRAVIIHRMDDDFHTQPSGNAGEKIACGVIESAC